MEIYIEYAFIENFLFDGALLWLAQKAAKLPIRWGRILLAATLGALFALLFPLLKLSIGLGVLLKLSAGALLCMVAFGRLKTKKEWGRYALNVFFFFAFSFGFGGTLLGVYGTTLSGTERLPSGVVFFGFTILTYVSLLFVRKLYARRAIYTQIYPCRVFFDEKMREVQGFYDSGNLASKNGMPVCFLCPALLYELLEEKMWKDGGQVCDEMVISTMAGKRKTPLYRGRVEVETGNGIMKKEVYFTPSKNMIGREYQILLGAGLLEKGEII